MFLLLLLLLCCLWFKIHYHYLLLDIFSWRQPQYLLEIIHNFGLSLNPFQLCQLGFSQDAYGVLKIEWECNSLVKLFRFSFSLLEKVMLFKGLIHFICYPVYFHKGVRNILFPFGLWRICSGIFFSISDNVYMCFFFFFLFPWSVLLDVYQLISLKNQLLVLSIFSVISTLQMSFLILTISFFILIMWSLPRFIM